MVNCDIMKKNDLILIIFLALLSFSLMGMNILLSGKRTGEAKLTITVDGKLFGTYSLDTDRVIPIGGTNTCTIKDGKVSMTYADCPDQSCVRSSSVGKEGGSIVCLPNRVILKVENEQPSDGSRIDTLAQ